MEIVHLHHPIDHDTIAKEPVVLAMGFFDGLHAGHREVLAVAKAKADELGVKLAVLTYDHHASVVFKTYDAPLQYLTTLPRKLELLAELGVDKTYVMNFTASYSAQAPQTFVDNYIVGLNAQVAVAGFDHTYGQVDADMAHLPMYSHGRFDVIEIPKVLSDGRESASRDARAMLDEGDLPTLNTLLTRPYQTSGTVVHGEARGRELGFPTANIETPNLERLPMVGVYVVRLRVGDTWYPGMASIGYNVTFGENRPKTVEINILDFKQNIYGESVNVEWLQYLRGEVKFTTAENLVTQLHQDEIDTRAYFAKQ
ncbi:riboflavin biosynthesis protein RibF [Weissella tructae]|uniref:Riboflavin biosynthesis protein n=2 Tax=Weissella TaxID=46255 RepID=A0A075TYT7_9LACO|nr:MULTISPECIES: riboflavin biosynthesis protein RibF [Weissella]AIG65380.1 Riboflavin biosynthesis protein [Weissella tructae]AIM62694.1 Riboflavin biosynthesis protein [Weissella ceti]AIM64029.1 Riboflavin biosynthesis protein [Weissella ceti]ELA07160.1 riboflavin biosynthesis protein RibF [Weissella ceti NC36]QVV91759.1 riboflavin biosynthesis protein RibF [Weissella tructae]